jgi:hypothetical protein
MEEEEKQRPAAAERTEDRREAETRYALAYDKTMPKKDPLSRCQHIEADPSSGIYVFGVDSIAQMVVKLQLAAPIDYLTLCGHGMAGMLGLGSGTSDEYQKGKDLECDHLGDIKVELVQLEACLSRSACVLLMGCHVAKGNAGKRLLRRLSRFLPGRRILASEMYLEPVVEDEDLCIHVAGGNNLKKGAVLTLFELVIALDGRTEDLGPQCPSGDDVLELIQWPASPKKRFQHD